MVKADLRQEVTLIAHAGSYGGVATHLNHFVSVLRDLCKVRGIFFFATDTVSVNHDGDFPILVLSANTPRWIMTNGALRALRVPLIFLREVLMVLRHSKYLLRTHIVLTSHDPNAFWGFVLLSKQAEYSLFVLPDVGHTEKKSQGWGVRIWNQLLRKLILRRIEQRTLRLATPTREAADIWSSYIGIDSRNVHAIAHPPFLSRDCESVIVDTQGHVGVVDDLEKRTRNGEKIVLSVGHLEDYKNPLKWVEFAQFAQRVEPNILFVWVGGGTRLREVRGAVSGDSRIILAGRLNQHDLRRLYRASWVFFHPAIKESQGIVVMDALALGLPVILNRSEALPGLIEHTNAGFVIDCSEPDAKTEFLDLLRRLQDPAQYLRTSKEATSLAERRFSYETWHQQLADLIKGHHA